MSALERAAARRLGAPVMWKATDYEIEAAVADALASSDAVTREHVTLSVAFYDAMREWLIHRRLRVSQLLVGTECEERDTRIRISVTGLRGIRIRRIDGPHLASRFRCSLFATRQRMKGLADVKWPTVAGLLPQLFSPSMANGSAMSVVVGVVRWDTTSDIRSLGSPRIA